MSILIGADFVPTQSNRSSFESGAKGELVDAGLLSILESADYRIFNLEVPLTDESHPIEKNGPNLIASTKSIAGYQSLKVDLLTLANNHIMDQGEEALKSTFAVLDKAGISYVGAGDHIISASKPFYFRFADKKVGVYACAEHEFSIADDECPGANPFDPCESFDHILSMKDNCDYIIVLYHGGKEHYRYPSPMLQKVCRKFIDKGAGLVVCQHSHCIGCEEKWKDGTIVYGQGNFLFDYSESEFWQSGLLIEIDEAFDIHYYPLSKDGASVKLASKDSSEDIMAEFAQRSRQILSPGFVSKEYDRFADSYLENYLFAFSGQSKNFTNAVLNKLTNQHYNQWVLKRKYTEKRKIAMRNYIECESHRELLLHGLQRKKQ